MALTTVGTLISQLGWTQTITENDVTQEDAGNITLGFTLSSGTGTKQVNGIWHADNILSSGGVDSFDLTAMTRNVLGGAYNVNFTNVKAIIIKNRQTGIGFDINLQATGANAFGNPFGFATGQFDICPSSALMRMNTYDGWNVGSGNSQFYIHDGGSGCAYSIAVIGVTG